MSIPAEQLTSIKSHAEQLRGANGRRNQLFEEIERIYLLTADDLPGEDWIKETISPDGRNAVNGAVRLLTSADPVFSVPRETNAPTLRKSADKLERAAKQIWDAAGMIANRPCHYDVTHSGVLYGEIHILMHSTKAIAQLQAGPGSKKRAEAIERKTPVLFEVVNPKDGHAQWGPMGMTAYYSQRKIKFSEIKDRFGKAVTISVDMTEQVTVHDYWSLDWHMVWMDEQTEPLVEEANKDGFIPVVAVICEGSFLFNKPDQDTRQPFLYTVLKSNLWKRKNLYLTVMNSLVFAIGANPLLVHESIDGESSLIVDSSTPGNRIVIRPGEKLYSLMQKIIDPQLVEQMSIIDRLFEESTMYKTATGQPLGSNAPFSMVSLLSQAGRLPLVVYQRMISMAVTLAIQGAFYIAKRDGTSLTASGKNGVQQIAAKDIPDEFDIRASLEISLPQDDRLNVSIAAQAVQAKLASRRYSRETYMKIGQSNDMDDEITEESFADIASQAELQKAMLKVQMEIQQMQQEMQMQAQQAQQQPPPGAVPHGIPPEAMMQGGPPMDGMQAQPGLPMDAPMEPEGSPFGPGGLPQGGEALPPEGMDYEQA